MHNRFPALIPSAGASGYPIRGNSRTMRLLHHYLLSPDHKLADSGYQLISWPISRGFSAYVIHKRSGRISNIKWSHASGHGEARREALAGRATCHQTSPGDLPIYSESRIVQRDAKGIRNKQARYQDRGHLGRRRGHEKISGKKTTSQTCFSLGIHVLTVMSARGLHMG